MVLYFRQRFLQNPGITGKQCVNMKKNSGKNRSLEKLRKASSALRTPEKFDYYSSGIESSRIFIPDNIHIWHHDGNLQESSPKQHSRYVLKILLSGSNISVLDEHVLKLNAGQALLIFPHQRHSNQQVTESSGVPEFLLINFLAHPSTQNSPVLLKNRVIELSAGDLAVILQLLESEQKTEKLDHGDTGMLLAWLLHRFQLRFQEASGTSSGGESIKKRMDDFIRRNFKKRLTLQMLCKQFNISRTTLQRIFAADTPRNTPGQQIRRLKLQESLEWVIHSENSIKEIALSCGYSDQFSFSRAFKKMFGQSPRNLRESQKSV